MGKVTVSENEIEIDDIDTPQADETTNAIPCASDESAGSAILEPPTFLRMNLMLSFNLCNGVLLSSYMLLILPLESERFDHENRSMVLGSLMCIAGVTQLINPFVGIMSDRCMDPRGRRRPFILVGGLVGCLGIFVQDIGSSRRNQTVYYLAYTASMLALNTSYTAVVGIMSDMIPSELSGTASGIAALHTLAGANLGFVVYNSVTGSIEERLHYMYMAFIVILTVCVTITVCSTNEIALTDDFSDAEGEFRLEGDALGKPTRTRIHGDAEAAPEKVVRTRSPRRRRCLTAPVRYRDLLDAYFIDPRKHFDFTLVFWSRTFYYLGASVQAFFKYYLKDVIGVEDPEAAIIKTAVIGQLCAACTAIPTGLLSDYIGKSRKPFIYAACVILAAGQILNCLATSEVEVYFIAGFLGCGNGIYLAMDAALALDTLPSGDEAARFMGVWGIGCFLGGAIGPVLGGPLLTLCGHNPARPDAYNFNGYAILLVIAAICFLISGAILFYVGSQANCTLPECRCVRRNLHKSHFRSIYDLITSMTSCMLYVFSASIGLFPKRWFSQRGNAPTWLNI